MIETECNTYAMDGNSKDTAIKRSYNAGFLLIVVYLVLKFKWLRIQLFSKEQRFILVLTTYEL